MKLMKSQHHNIVTSTTGLAHRVFLLMLLLCMSVESVWGQLTVTDLTGNMYTGGSTTVNLNNSTDLVYGDVNVLYSNYADLINYKVLEIVVTEGTPRLLFNRASGDGNGGDFLEINAKTHSYVTAQGSTWRIDLEKIKLNDAGHNVHLNAIKAAYGQTINIQSLTLYSYPSNSLTSEIFKTWSDVGRWVSQTGTPSCDDNFGNAVSNGTGIYGDGSNVACHNYADLTNYSKLQVSYTGAFPRFLFNRQNDNNTDNGMIEVNSAGTYATVADGIITIDLAKLASDHGEYVHLNAIKAPWGESSTTVSSGRLYTADEWASIAFPTLTKGTTTNTKEEELVVPANNQFTISAAYFKALFGSYPCPGYLRFTAYNSNNEMIEIPEVTSAYRNWYSFGEDGYASHDSQSLFWDDAGSVVVTLPAGIAKLECYAHADVNNWSGNCIERNGGWLITYTLPALDTFESSLKTGGSKGYYLKDYVEIETTSTVVEFTKALEKLGSTPKYVRFILTKNGKAVDPTGLLSISGATPAPQQTSKPKQGYYLYNSGNALSTNGITVTLNTPDYGDYRVVCLLSTDAAAAAAGNVVETEPQWDVQYTYSFTKVTMLPFSQLTNSYVRLNIHDQVLSYFGKTEEEMKDSWHADWSVRDKSSRAVQPLRKGYEQGDNVWSAYVGYWDWQYQNGNDYGATLNQNYIYAGKGTAESQGKDKLEAVQRMLGFLQLYAPTAFSTMQGASDYEIVYQVDDEYVNVWMPDMKGRWIFRITPFENEPNTGMTTAEKPQTISDRAAASFTLTDMPSDAKYARFYLLDKDNNAIAPGTILSVTGGTACAKTTSGIYLYNSGSILSSPTVTIAAPKAYKNYRVVGLFSTALDDIDAEGATVNHEPKWDMQWTYTFDYSITTNDQTPQVEWNAKAMATDASAATDLDTDWNTSLDELTAGQCVKWWVENGSGEKQALELGKERQYAKWTIDLPTPFAVSSNVASLAGVTSIEPAQLASWVTTNVYAPSEATYASVASHKIVCEIYTNNNGTGTPNARYTFSIHKGFVGSLKAVASPKIIRVNPTAGATTHTFNTTIPAGTRHSRFYLTDLDGNPVDYTGKLNAQYSTPVNSSVEGYDVSLGTYRYAADPIGFNADEQITLTLSDATLDQYKIVVVTSGDAAVFSGDVMMSEPDWDTMTTYWFKYPATEWAAEANVEWSAQSMQITAPDIETEKGAGYLANNVSHYTMQWLVVDKNGTEQPLRQGNNRANDYWTFSVNGDPFALANSNKVLMVTNNDKLSVATWNNWAAPAIFAPANKTMREIAEDGIKFVCKFYEDDQSPLTDDLCAMTYTVFIDRTVKPGQLKDGGQRDSETLTPTASPMTIDLTAATAAFATKVGGTPRYARVYLTKNDGTLLNPTTDPEMLINVGGTAFTTPEYGYYFSNESGITLPTNATLTLPAGKFNFYNVVIALSGDAGETGHTGAFAPHHAPHIESIYEPDYDLIYTIKFAETSTFPGAVSTPAFTHSKEVLVKDETVKTAALSLADSKSKILSEYLVPDWATLRSSFHIRWFVAKKNDEGDYEKIPGSELYLSSTTSDKGHQTEADQGLYWNSVTQTYAWPASLSESDVLNVTFNRNPGGGAPELTGNWEDYKVFVYMTKDLTGQTDDGGSPKKLTHEPDVLDMVYTFSFFKETAFLFVHDTGAGTDVYMRASDDGRLAATVQQYNWNNSTSTREAVSGDIRQWVHTMEYDLFVDPSSSTPVTLHLPFENYTTTGNVLEPAAYLRWYDWNTDVNNNRLTKVGTELADLIETNNGVSVSRGFFFLNNDVNGFQPTHDKVGVTFNPNGVDGLITIACDVSKYYDGIYTGSTGEYLMHEPTLSTRYIFNIRPASVIATDIKIGQDKFEAGGSDMFELAEDNGRVCVSIKGTGTGFTVRSALPTLNSYFFYDGSNLVNSTKIKWLPYYVDEDGHVWKFNGYFDGANYNRIKQFTVASMSGTYISVDDGVTTKSVTVGAGSRIHLVGFLCNEADSKRAPVVHYELNFMEAPAIAVGSLPLERTEAWLKEHMTLQDQVIFDNVPGAVLSGSIASQLENHTNSPMPWAYAQYGFCYPDVRRIWTGSGDQSGISPIHGDYMLLRSMNLAGISPTDMELYYKYHWYVGSPTLYDYTKTMGGDYGTFLYVDASDESRTIARMSFNANLCAGSELCFTGVLANMTIGTNPQVMTTVYAVDNIGRRTRVVSFHSSELCGDVIQGTYENGVWYQIYGRIAIPATVDLSGVDHYEVDIDNYALNTNGADYCVDQLMFYTSNAKLKVKQAGVNCGDAEIPMNLYVDAEGIEPYAGKTIFWRICDKDGNALTDAGLYDNGTKLYGQTTVPASIPATPENEASLPTPFSGYFTGTDGNLYFSLAKKGFALKEGADYYVSVYSMGETSVAYESLWGNSANTCSVFSPVFVPKMMFLSVQDGSGNTVTTVTAECSTHEAAIDLNVVLNMPDDREVSGFHQYTNVHYDYFKGTLAEFEAYTLTSDPSVSLQAAMRNFRGKQGTLFNTTYTDPPGTAYSNIAYATSANLPDAYKSVNGQKYYDVIKQAMDAGLLYLSCSSSIKLSVSKAHPSISALPIEDQVTYNTLTYDVCSPLEYTFTVNDTGGGPSIVLGFEDVTTYPSGIRVVRVGKEQLDNLQKDDGCILHIPVNTFKKNDSATPKDGTLEIQGDLELLAYNASANQTSDDQITANVSKIATFEETEITSTYMYISLNFHGTGVTKPTFHEGFAYRMFFQFKDKDGGPTACDGSVEFLLKVVPKYVTWNGTTNEWNSDANWKRSAREELYKGTTTATNTDSYEQNGEGALSAVVTTPNTYVPMKFTYVTLPTGLRAPDMVNLAYDAEGIYNNIGTGATDNIQYDLMVKYETDASGKLTGGCSHPVMIDDSKIYDCEKFYGNWAKELYMKPGAELLNQQYLTYEKVWVEKELTANTWSLMSTPLQNTYAGDMYVPYSTTATDNGRQLTEAFQPISFSTTANAAGIVYSRTKYPVYQKGWTQEGVYVKTKTNDVRATQYSANIPGGVSTLLNQWSHGYNDVTVPYSTWTAFAIRPHKKDQTAKTLIRLPKADTSYDYYQWDNTSPSDGKLTQDVSKTTTGKLLTDGSANISGVTYGTVYGVTPRTAGDGTFNAAIANIQSSPANYQLVGNPYLCSIDMEKFVTGNATNLEVAGYWTYDDNNTGSPVTTGVIAPMQSFFVKAKDGATNITFTPDMMKDGHSATPTPAPQYVMTLTAHNERGGSVASVQLSDERKSVETLFDSNLEDVPMVYTVADGMAVSINQLTEFDIVPFGVTYNGNEPVEVKLSGIETIGSELYVFDAMTSESIAVNDGESVSVQPNDYGRYFLTRTSSLGEMSGDVAEGIIVSVRGKEVTVTAPEGINRIQVCSLNGTTVYQAGACGTSASFTLASGVYIIKAENADGVEHTVKIVVK